MQELEIVLLLHAYQPPDQTTAVMEQITRECYEALGEALAQTPTRGPVSMDIAASLLEQLESFPAGKRTIDMWAKLTQGGKISLVNTAAWHPILPLISSQEYIVHQLAANVACYRRLGLALPQEDMRGLFPPEMAVAPYLLTLLRQLGYAWTVTDDVPFRAIHDINTPATWIPSHADVACFLRSSWYSNLASGDNMPHGRDFAEDMHAYFSHMYPRDERAYVVLAMDAETFGHHHKDGMQKFLIPFLEATQHLPVALCSPRALLEHYPLRETSVPAGSWSTSSEDMRANNPFPLWKDPAVEWHQKWWELAEIILHIGENIATDSPCRQDWERALHSCQTWWYARGRVKDIFLWAVPRFERLLREGTPTQQQKGREVIQFLKEN